MEVAAKRYQDQLARIKKTVKNSYDYFKSNYDRFNEFRRFVFESSLSDADITLLSTLSKPQLEFNVLEAYISRLMGEFSKQEPDIEVSSDDQFHTDPQTISILEQHLRHVLCDSNNQHTRYEVYKDLLSGGFSVMKVLTKYANPMSFDQVIEITRAEPTLCGFDPTARFSHKGDGRFCHEIFPFTREDFESEYPDIDLKNISFKRDFGGFNWSYINDNQEILLVCDYYEKKKKEIKIVQLTNKKVLTLEKYKEMIDTWGEFSAPPSIVGKPRKTIIENICRHRLIENQVIEYEETDFTHFPLIFFDGNSVLLKTPKNGNIRQFTRPYVYHAKGAQRLKNYAGVSLANEIENTVQHKFMVAKEALPKEEEFLEAYKDVQKSSVMVYNQFFEQNPDQPIPNPIREVQRIPAPPEMIQAFQGTDSLIQNVLGSYDASLGINNNQLSGIAIVEAASQSNATAMPFIVGFCHGLSRVAQVYVDLFPKYSTTPRTIPILDNEGKRSYVKINQEGGVNLFYDSNVLNVVVKAGASFQVQKSRTLMMVKELSGMSPLFAQFIAEKGLNFVLDNMEGKGIDQLKKMVDGWLQEMQQQKQMAMQMQQQEMQNNPAMMKAQNDRMKLQQESQKSQSQFALDMAKLKMDEQKILSGLQQSRETSQVQLVKAETERFAKEVDLQIKNRDMAHKHAKDIAGHHLKTKEAHHNMNQTTKNQ